MKNERARPRRAALAAAMAAMALASLALPTCSTAAATPTMAVDKKNQAAQYLDMGKGYFESGDYDNALRFFRLALELNTSVDNAEGVAQAYNSIGRVYLEAGSFDQAREAFSKAMDAAESSGDPAAKALTLSDFGDLAIREGKLAEAKARFEAALALVKGGDKTSAFVYHGLGVALKGLGEGDKALEWFTKAAEINKSLSLWADVAANEYMAASVLSKKGDYAAAEARLLSALDWDKKAENALGIGKDYSALGTVLRKKGDAEKGYAYLAKAYEVYLAANRAREILELLPKLIAEAQALGKASEAERYSDALAKLKAAITAESAGAAAPSAAPSAAPATP